VLQSPCKREAQAADHSILFTHHPIPLCLSRRRLYRTERRVSPINYGFARSAGGAPANEQTGAMLCQSRGEQDDAFSPPGADDAVRAVQYNCNLMPSGCRCFGPRRSVIVSLRLIRAILAN